MKNAEAKYAPHLMRRALQPWVATSSNDTEERGGRHTPCYAVTRPPPPQCSDKSPKRTLRGPGRAVGSVFAARTRSACFIRQEIYTSIILSRARLVDRTNRFFCLDSGCVCVLVLANVEGTPRYTHGDRGQCFKGGFQVDVLRPCTADIGWLRRL